MKKSYIISSIFFTIFMSESFYAQTSLWNNSNPASSNLNNNEILTVLVDENFTIKIDDKWNRNIEMDLMLTPDREYGNFLKPVEESRSNARKVSEKQSVSERIKFSLPARIEEQGNNLYRITATKSFSVDNKESLVQITGFIHARYVKNRSVRSSDIADLTMSITSIAKAEKNNQIQMQAPEAPVTENQVAPGSQVNQAPATPVLTEQEKKDITLKYIQEVMGALNQ